MLYRDAAKASHQDGGDSSICCTCAGTGGGVASDFWYIYIYDTWYHSEISTKLYYILLYIYCYLYIYIAIWSICLNCLYCIYIMCIVLSCFHRDRGNHFNLTINQLCGILRDFDFSTCFIVYYPGQSTWGHDLPDRHWMCWLNSQHRYQTRRWEYELGLCVEHMFFSILCSFHGELWFYIEGSVVYTIFWTNPCSTLWAESSWHSVWFHVRFVAGGAGAKVSDWQM